LIEFASVMFFVVLIVVDSTLHYLIWKALDGEL
jgi:hypothetical protein